MAICVIHPKTIFAEKGVCYRCKSCTHKSWFIRSDGKFQCNDCYKQVSVRPKGEVWRMVGEEWKLDN